MVISGKTKLCAIIGDPVEHSLSPVMHNAAFNKLGLNIVYLAFKVTSKELENAILGVKSLGLRGLNVTMPHKTAVVNYIDEVDLTTKSIGAVNTILNNHGCLVGYNTDGRGAIISLKENGVDTKNKKLLLIGAGGAAKAIAYYAAQDVAELVILNRTLEKAGNIVEGLKSFSSKVKAGILSFETLKNELQTTDILINATSVGMSPLVKRTPVPLDLLHSGLCVMDIIYNPIQTRLVKDAISVGAKVVTGIEMLIYQGAVAFEIWTKCPAPVDVMREAALNELKKGAII
jgi:shikimate dehydrogenase